jgi:hypothetical protein
MSAASTPAWAIAPWSPYFVIGRGDACTPQRPAMGIGADATVSPKAWAMDSGGRPRSRPAATVAANAAQAEPATGEMTVRPSGFVSSGRKDSAILAARSKPTATAAVNWAPDAAVCSATASAAGTVAAARCPEWRIVSSASSALAACALTYTAPGRLSRSPLTSTVACAGPPTSALSLATIWLEGTPLPPTAQPRVSRISRRVAARALSGRSSAVTEQANSARARV